MQHFKKFFFNQLKFFFLKSYANYKMLQYLAKFLLFKLIVMIEFSHARTLNESDNFPPYKCGDQPFQVVFLMSFFLNFFEKKF